MLVYQRVYGFVGFHVSLGDFGDCDMFFIPKFTASTALVKI